MQAFLTKGRLIVATVVVILMVVVFVMGARRGYDWGYTDGQDKANSWWIEKKSRYYESSEIKKKRINLKYNRI